MTRLRRAQARSVLKGVVGRSYSRVDVVLPEMNLRWKIGVGFVVAAIAGSFWIFHSNHGVQREVQETREELRREGFRVDLSEFNLTNSPELRRRALVLLKAGQPGRFGFGFRGGFFQLPAVGSNAAVVVWKREDSSAGSAAELLTSLDEGLKEDQADLDEALLAVMAGPIRIGLGGGERSGMRRMADALPLRGLCSALAARCLLDLRDGNLGGGWSNLIGAVRLATAGNRDRPRWIIWCDPPW